MSSPWRDAFERPRPQLAAVLLVMAALSRGVRGFTVCVIPDGPWTTCTVNVTKTTSFAGYDVELFRFVAGQVGWREVVGAGDAPIESGMWSFKCSEIYWDLMMGVLADNRTDDPALSPCAISFGDMIPTSLRYHEGVQFSAPYYHTGLAIMVAAAPPAAFDIWGFLKPFDWSTWLGIGLTLMFVPGIIWFVERLNVHRSVPLTKDSLDECHTATYETLLACFNLRVYTVTTLPAQLVVIVYLFLILITVSTYTANLAAVFTNAGGTVIPIKSWKDLVNRTIATPGVYMEGLQIRYGLNDIIPGGYESNVELLIAGKEALLNGSIAAYVTNLESIQQFMGVGGYNTDCSLGLVMFDVLEPSFNFAFGFHHNFPLAVIAANVSSAIAQAEETGLLYSLHNKYLEYEDSCQPAASSQSVHFYQLSGLWILLAAALGFALCWSFVTIVILARRHMRYIHEERAALFVTDDSIPGGGGDSAHINAKIVGEAMSRVFVPPSMVRASKYSRESGTSGVYSRSQRVTGSSNGGDTFLPSHSLPVSYRKSLPRDATFNSAGSASPGANSAGGGGDSGYNGTAAAAALRDSGHGSGGAAAAAAAAAVAALSRQGSSAGSTVAAAAAAAALIAAGGGGGSGGFAAAAADPATTHTSPRYLDRAASAGPPSAMPPPSPPPPTPVAVVTGGDVRPTLPTPPPPVGAGRVPTVRVLLSKAKSTGTPRAGAWGATLTTMKSLSARMFSDKLADTLPVSVQPAAAAAASAVPPPVATVPPVATSGTTPHLGSTSSAPTKRLLSGKEAGGVFASAPPPESYHKTPSMKRERGAPPSSASRDVTTAAVAATAPSSAVTAAPSSQASPSRSSFEDAARPTDHSPRAAYKIPPNEIAGMVADIRPLQPYARPLLQPTSPTRAAAAAAGGTLPRSPRKSGGGQQPVVPPPVMPTRDGAGGTSSPRAGGTGSSGLSPFSRLTSAFSFGGTGGTWFGGGGGGGGSSTGGAIGTSGGTGGTSSHAGVENSSSSTSSSRHGHGHLPAQTTSPFATVRLPVSQEGVALSVVRESPSFRGGGSSRE